MVEEKYKTLEVVEKNPKSGVFHLYLNRPRQHNALTHDIFTEFPKALYALDHNHDVNSYHDAGESLRRQILAMQDSITALERCRKPVIAGIHGACIGGAIDIVTACDLRYCTEDTFFSVKEVDLALAADLGTLQRLPLIVGYGNAMELALTARRFSRSEAKQLGLISRAFPSKDDLDQAGSCVAGRDFPAALCNRKIIGARYFSACYEATNGKMNDTLEYQVQVQPSPFAFKMVVSPFTNSKIIRSKGDTEGIQTSRKTEDKRSKSFKVEKTESSHHEEIMDLLKRIQISISKGKSQYKDKPSAEYDQDILGEPKKQVKGIALVIMADLHIF
ncbi:hypothetical protein HN873_004377 [Arachis hypogaea]